MISVTDAIKQRLFIDDFNCEALRQGTLNLRAYAKKIHPDIENLTKKSVKIGSMVMALSRIERTLDEQQALKPVVQIESLSVKSGLIVENYEKNLRYHIYFIQS